jgi:hypothetical protein
LPLTKRALILINKVVKRNYSIESVTFSPWFEAHNGGQPNFYCPLRTSDFLESKKDAVAHPAHHLAYASHTHTPWPQVEARVKDEWNLSRRIYRDPTRLNSLARRIPPGPLVMQQITPKYGYILNPVWLIG